ncbi:MAG TPA: DUF4010 domain-containing protein, partial [Gemmatimonadales bacterium]|nr:DUF4010 domain-containing protein [Gemmatimonadales bacterium]
ARDLGVALLAGLAVGIERERSGHATGPGARFAGARTFLMLGLVGGLAGWLTAGGAEVAGGIILAGGVLLTGLGYVMAARLGGEGVGATTEVAALAVLALGVASGAGFPLLTSAATSVIVLVLVEKSRIHDLVGRIGEVELAAALKFAVLALVILPLLPAGPYGPNGAIRPQSLWVLVLLFSGLNFAGYVARRIFGPTRGYGMAGLLGGVVSSTLVTLTFGMQSRRTPSLSRALAWGSIAACAFAVPRVLAVTLVLSPVVAQGALGYLVLPMVVGLAMTGWVIWHRPETPVTPALEGEIENPLRLGTAIRMAIGFQLVLFALPLVLELWGRRGVLSSAVLLGITDVDALTVSMVQLQKDTGDTGLAALGIAVGVVATGVFKTGLVLVLGSREFRWRAGLGILGLALLAAFGLWLALPMN